MRVGGNGFLKKIIFCFNGKSYFASLKLIATLCSWLCAEKQMHLMVFSTDWVGEKEQQHPLHRVLDREHQEVSPGTAGWFKVISIKLIPLNTWDRAVKYYIILELQLWNTTSYLSYSCEILHHTWATAVKYYIIRLLQLWNTTSYACYSCEILHHTLATAVKYCFTLLDTVLWYYYILLEAQL